MTEACWQVTLRPDDRSINDEAMFTFIQKSEFDGFCKSYRASQSAWSITDICEFQASTAVSALEVIANAKPGDVEERDCTF